MVWLHGGGFTLFSGASSVYDGHRLAARGDVVVVTLNHRLNVFGYLYLSDLLGPDYADSGNVGQLDIIAALKWVRDNIEEFGGDPDSVTIFGESGGGGKVGTLMAMPQAQGLFHRAIMQSGFAITAITTDTADKMTNSLLTALHLHADEAAKLKTLSVARLLDALQEVTHGLPFGLGPVVDGRSLPKHPFSPEAPTVSARVPLIVGSNKDETTVLFPPAGAFDLDWPGLKSQLQSTMPAAKVEALIAGFRRLRPEASASDIYFTITTELSMGANADAVAERKAALQAAPVYRYRLEWMTPVESGRLRTPHALDLPMIFDNVAKSDSLIGEGASHAQQVANAMSAAWIAFARTGSSVVASSSVQSSLGSVPSGRVGARPARVPPPSRPIVHSTPAMSRPIRLDESGLYREYAVMPPFCQEGFPARGPPPPRGPPIGLDFPAGLRL